MIFSERKRLVVGDPCSAASSNFLHEVLATLSVTSRLSGILDSVDVFCVCVCDLFVHSFGLISSTLSFNVSRCLT